MTLTERTPVAHIFDRHLDDSRPWAVEAQPCPDCERQLVIIHRVDRTWACPHCVITDRAVPLPD